MACRIHLVAGTRPNVMKIAPLYAVLKQQAWCQPRIIYLRQHFSANMSDDLFAEFDIGADEILSIPLTDGDYGLRIGEIVQRYSQVIGEDRPDLALVPGDVDVSLGAALAARRLGVPIAHLEAGLRSYDKAMPEEANRVLIDSIADILLAPSEASAQNLIYREGRSHQEVHFVGNVMIDSLVRVLDAQRAARVVADMGLTPRAYGVATLHRPGNIDSDDKLADIMALITDLAAERTMVFPVHPRTRKRLQDLSIAADDRVRLLDPMGYTDFVNLVSLSRFVLTDSGGLQEETSFMDVPCLTLRDNTERPITLYAGTNHLADLGTARDLAARITQEGTRPAKPPLPLWDGLASWRVAQVLKVWWDSRRSGAA